MAMTLQPSAFSTSTSSFRASQSQPAPMAYGDNPLTQLPTVDFNFEDLRQRMAAFSVKFDVFIEKGRKRVLEERNEFRGRLGELSGTSQFVHGKDAQRTKLEARQERKLTYTHRGATFHQHPDHGTTIHTRHAQPHSVA